MALKARAMLAAALLAACASTTYDIGSYEVVAPAASGGGERRIRVSLHADGSAAVSSVFSTQPSRSLVPGRWTRTDGQIVVMLDGPRPERMVFRHSGDLLFPREWDHATWGQAGPGVMTRVR